MQGEKVYVDSEHLIWFDHSTKCFHTTFGDRGEVSAARVWRYLTLSEDEIGMEHFRILCPDYDYNPISPEKQLEIRYGRIADAFRFAAVLYWLPMIWFCLDVLRISVRATGFLLLGGLVLCLFMWNRYATKCKDLMEWEPPTA